MKFTASDTLRQQFRLKISKLFCSTSNTEQLSYFLSNPLVLVMTSSVLPSHLLKRLTFSYFLFTLRTNNQIFPFLYLSLPFFTFLFFTFFAFIFVTFLYFFFLYLPLFFFSCQTSLNHPSPISSITVFSPFVINNQL